MLKHRLFRKPFQRSVRFGGLLPNPASYEFMSGSCHLMRMSFPFADVGRDDALCPQEPFLGASSKSSGRSASHMPEQPKAMQAEQHAYREAWGPEVFPGEGLPQVLLLRGISVDEEANSEAIWKAPTLCWCLVERA